MDLSRFEVHSNGHHVTTCDIAELQTVASNISQFCRNPRKIRLIMLVDCDDKGEQSSYIEDDGDKKCIKEGAFKERHPGGLHEITMPMSKSYYWILHCHYCDNAHKTKIGDGNGPVVEVKNLGWTKTGTGNWNSSARCPTCNCNQ